jgi:hypothetical protein
MCISGHTERPLGYGGENVIATPYFAAEAGTCRRPSIGDERRRERLPHVVGAGAAIDEPKILVRPKFDALTNERRTDRQSEIFWISVLRCDS